MAKQWKNPPTMQIDPKKKYKAHMETDKGTMVIELFADKVPNTVNNFVFLAREGFYEGVMFHRVISSFMAQGGDPTGRGSGGPGYKFADEIDRSLIDEVGQVPLGLDRLVVFAEAVGAVEIVVAVVVGVPEEH